MFTKKPPFERVLFGFFPRRKFRFWFCDSEYFNFEVHVILMSSFLRTLTLYRTLPGPGFLFARGPLTHDKHVLETSNLV